MINPLHKPGSKPKSSRAGARLQRSAKISNYRFRRVLEQFVADASTVDAARTTGLSIPTVQAIYRRLRVFFFEVGLFQDFYEGEDPVEFVSDNPVFERDLLAFHFARISEKRGLKQPLTEPPYHFAESCWRYDFSIMKAERPDAPVKTMMLAHLLELIRLCGPIGASPRNRVAGIRAVARFTDQRIAWLHRNAPGFSDGKRRAALMEARAIDPFLDWKAV